MKKFLVTLLSAAMIVASCSVSFAAIGISGVTGDESGTIDVIPQVGENPSTGVTSSNEAELSVSAQAIEYSLDITWKSLEFTAKADWDIENLGYGYIDWDGDGNYVADESAPVQTITLVNKSNTAFDLSYTAGEVTGGGVKGVSAKFCKSDDASQTAPATIPTAEADDKDESPNNRTTVVGFTVYGGTMWKNMTEPATASVTIQIEDADIPTN